MMSTFYPRLPSAIPLPLEENELKNIVEKSKDWALMHGAAMRSKTHFSPDALQFAPFVLIPSTFPRVEFTKAVNLQQTINELIHKVAHNRDFLTDTLRDTIKVDEFTGNLFKIYEAVMDEGVNQTLSLGLVRSDLMLESACRVKNQNCLENANYCCWKQVEVNTIASGFGWLGPVSKHIQSYVLQELGHNDLLQNLPENGALEGLCGGMLDAWHLYGNKNSVILFIVEDVTYNICDQRFHEFQIRKMNPEARVLRRTLSEIAQFGCLNSSGELLIDGNTVAVIYFRAGYEPGHYPTQKEWEARLLMERSKAIKCPSIQYHLAGTKKVQQALAQPGILEQFLTDEKKIESLRDIFIGLYALDLNEDGNRAFSMAIDDPERFVLKPQREGGGNNVYGKDIKTELLKMKESNERSAWILMERIRPPVSAGYIVRPGGPNPPELVDMISELGIFGVVIGDAEKVLINRQVGHMLRTKKSTANEGGVAAGLGALDSPCLID